MRSDYSEMQNPPVNIPGLFDEARTAQAAAFLLHCAGGSMPLIKLMKLLYLAERRSFELHGEPICGDALVSMDHGPVLSRTYDLMNGATRGTGDWDRWISDRANHDVALAVAAEKLDPVSDLGALCPADIDVLRETWGKFGAMGKWAIRDYTHSDAVPEWEDPNGSSTPISYERLLQALGYDRDDAKAAISHLQDMAAIKRVANQPA